MQTIPEKGFKSYSQIKADPDYQNPKHQEEKIVSLQKLTDSNCIERKNKCKLKLSFHNVSLHSKFLHEVVHFYFFLSLVNMLLCE